MSGRWLSLAAALLMVEPAPAGERQAPPAFRLGVELVTLSVTVSTADGRHVGDLDADDFVILEDGRPQELAFFSRASSALSVSLLLDSSASMDKQMPLAQKAAMELLARLRPGDVAQVVEFDSRVEVLQPFTGDRSALQAAVERTHAGGSTSLYNGIYIALRQLERLRAQHRDELRREVIVVLSDGEDTSSLVDFEAVLDLAKRSQTVIYTINLSTPIPTGAAKPLSAEYALRRFAQETGGRLFTPKQAADLSGVYGEIADELTSQYVLGYLSSNPQSDGAWRQVAVRVGRPNLRARTRPGYYAAPTTRLGQ